MKRNIDILVLSDLHLGTFGCAAKELNKYLDSINAKTIILNGDIIDAWSFKKKRFNKHHIKVVRKVLKFSQKKDNKVYYIIGNHDDFLRQYDDLVLGNIIIQDKLTLEVDGQKLLFLHGDLFDFVIKYHKWIGVLGSWMYDMLIHVNSMYNNIRYKFGLPRSMFSSRLKKVAKSACKFINDFEDSCISYGMKKGYDAVFCGHIHEPNIKDVFDGDKKITYYNSGDWIENLSSLEYYDGKWHLYRYVDITS